MAVTGDQSLQGRDSLQYDKYVPKVSRFRVVYTTRTSRVSVHDTGCVVRLHLQAELGRGGGKEGKVPPPIFFYLKMYIFWLLS